MKTISILKLRFFYVLKQVISPIFFYFMFSHTFHEAHVTNVFLYTIKVYLI